MTNISSKYNMIGAISSPDSQPRDRRHSVGNNPADFQKTLETMRQAIDLAMADRFLSVSMGWNEQNDEERQGGGIGLNAVGMNMLATLSKLQTLQDIGSGEQPSSAGNTPTEPETTARSVSQSQGEHSPDTMPMVRPDTRQAEATSPSVQDMAGELARRFESGENGSLSIGWDRVGGTSYGIFQLSSKQGTMDRFLDFLDSEAPEWAARLRKAGPSDTGGRDGSMPREWRAIAAESPELFEAAQMRFINNSHYQPALQAVLDRTGLDVSSLPKALQEVLFSTAVQHGPSGAADIFARAAAGLDGVLGQDGFSAENIAEHLIREVYMQRSTRFGSSTEQVQAAVRNRFKSEHKLAMSLLSGAGESELA